MSDASSTEIPRFWREDSKQRMEDIRAKKRLRAILLRLGLGLALIGAMLAMLTWIRPATKPSLVALWVATPQARALPPAAMAVGDLESLERGEQFTTPRETIPPSQGKARLESELGELQQRTRAQSVVVYLRALACLAASRSADQETTGKVELMVLPADANPNDPAAWLPLKSVLGSFAQCRVRRRLLILDVMQKIRDPRLELLSGDIATWVDEELKAAPDAGRLVLMSCSPGQSAETSEILGRSTFGFFLEQGLRGSADGEGRSGSDDGIITVAELAAYLSKHVDRWAQYNRGTHQRPVLRGSIDSLDFPLVALASSQAAQVEIPQTRDYPGWLLAGWRLRDQWVRDGSARVAPWAFRRMEALLLNIEEKWRSRGSPEELLTADLGNELEQIERHWGEVRKRAHPEPRTLGMERMLGLKPDLGLADDVRRLIESLAEPAPSGKEADTAKARGAKLEAFLDKVRQVDERKLSWAVVLQAATAARPSPETILAFDGILKNRRREPRYLETLALRRASLLAEQATAGSPQIPPSNWTAWRPAAVHAGLELSRLAGIAENRPEPLSWVRPLLREAAATRQEAEIMLWQPGFTPSEVTQASLDSAISRYNAVLSIQDTIEHGWTLIDESMAFLPSFSPLLRKSLEMESSWRTAIQETRNLYGLLAVDPRITKDPSKVGPEVKAVESLAASLQGHLTELRAFARDLRGQLIRQSAEPEAQGSICASVDAFLETPLANADERVELWKSGQSLARRLLEESLAAAAQTHEGTGDDLQQDEETDGVTEAASQEARRVARWSIDLLQLGGLETSELENELRKASQPDTAASYPVDLGQRLFSAWSKDLLQALESRMKDDTGLIAADRLSRIVPPLDPFDRLADPGTNPTRRLRARLLGQLWSWLAGLYDDESRDLGSSNLLAEAAMGCRDLAIPGPRPVVQFTGNPPLVELGDEHPAARVDLNYRVSAAGKARPVIEPLGVATEWLRITGSPPSEKQTDDSGTASLLVALTAEGLRSRDQPPRGFLARARIDGHSVHARINLAVETSADKPRMVLSAESKMPADGLKRLRIRPTKGLQLFYVFIRNPSAKPRKLKVIVKAGEVQLPGGVADLTVNAAASDRVSFGGTGAPPAPPAPGSANSPTSPAMVELAGPLTLTLIDGDSGKQLSQTTLDVDLASPVEYLRLVNARFEPPSAVNKGKNRFIASLESLGRASGAPIKAELVLSPSQIPGLKGVSEGGIRSEINPQGGEATLMARDIQLDQLSDERGRVYIDVDEYKRAYVLDTTFARHGDPTTPQIDFAPDLRVNARPVARSGSTYDVDFEVDNAPAGATLHVALGRVELSGFVADRVFAARAPRNRRLSVGIVQGTIALEAALSDWSLPIDTTGLAGQLVLQAVLSDKDGREIKKVTHRVIVDGSAPQNVRIVGLPAQGRRGSEIQVRATGRPSESGMKEVSFFWGKPVEGKLPPNTETVRAEPADASETAWVARLKLPDDKKGATPLSVQFVSAAGAAAFDSRTIEITDTEPSRVGRLRIKVLEGDRPQVGLSVLVQDAKGAVKQQGKTGPDGVYLTGALEKGDYTVRSAKPATPSLGQSKATVDPGRTKLVTVDLFYKRLR